MVFVFILILVSSFQTWIKKKICVSKQLEYSLTMM